MNSNASLSAPCKAAGIMSPGELRAALIEHLPGIRKDATTGVLRGWWNGVSIPPDAVREAVRDLLEARQSPEEGHDGPAGVDDAAEALEGSGGAPEKPSEAVTFTPPADWNWDGGDAGIPGVSNAKVIAVIGALVGDGEVVWGTTLAGPIIRGAKRPEWKGRAISDPALAGVGTNVSWLGRADANNYLSIGVFDEAAKSRVQMMQRGVTHIVLDDVGKKARWPSLPPSMVVETSPGCFQVHYFLVGVERDLHAVERLIDWLGKQGWSDASADQRHHYFRLPVGSNTKEDYAEPFACKLRVWAPTRRYTLAQIAKALGLHLGDEPSATVDSASIVGVHPSPTTSTASAVTALRAPGADSEEQARHVARALGCIENDGRFDRRNKWIDMLHAIWAACQGDPGGLDAFLEWCSAQHQAEDPVEVWRSVKDVHTLGWRYIMEHLAEDAERNPEAKEVYDDLTRVTAQARFTADPTGTGAGMAPPIDDDAVEALADAVRAEHEANLPEWLREFNAKYAYIGALNRVVEFDAEGRPCEWYTTAGFRTFFDNVREPRGQRMVGRGTFWLGDADRRTYRRVGVFHPTDLMPGDYNIWRGLSAVSAPGPWPTIRAYIFDILCSGDTAAFDWLIRWLARLIQHPMELGETGILLLGPGGTGKGMLYRLILRLLGTGVCLYANDENVVFGRFNDAVEGKVFLFLDEAMFGHDRPKAKKLKSHLTEPWLNIETKNVPIRQTRNIGHYVCATNEIAALPIDMDDRRFTVLRVSEAHRKDEAYFKALVAAFDTELAAFADHLLTLDLTGWNHRNPYYTSAKAEVAAAVATPEIAFWLRALEDGRLPGSDTKIDWAAGPVEVPKAALYADYERYIQNVRGRVRQVHELLGVIKGYCPGMQNAPRRWLDKGKTARAPRGLWFPALADARAAWEARAGARDWEEGVILDPLPLDPDADDIV